MRRPGFYFHQTDADPQRSKGQVGVFECDGFVCAHCGKGVFVKPFCDPADMGGWCRMCGGKDYLSGLICNSPICNSRCLPFEKALERVEAGKMLFTDIGK